MMSVDRKFSGGVRRAFARNVALAVLMASGLSLGIAGSAGASIAHTITQVSPGSGTVTTPNSAALSVQLNVTGNSGSVTYTTVAGPVDVSSTGLVTVPSTLAAATYTVSGFTSDAFLGTGTYNYQLTVIPGTMPQAAPTTGTVTTPNSSAFTASLSMSGNFGTVTYSTVSGPVNVNSSGTVSTGGTLHVGVYTVNGTVSDPNGDTGTYSYALTVTTGSISNFCFLWCNSTTTPVSSGFTDSILNYMPNSYGVVTFTTASGSIDVASNGFVSVPSTLATGSYSVSGTMSDANGDTGSYSYSLLVLNGGIYTSKVGAAITTATSFAYSDSLPTPVYPYASFGALTYVAGSNGNLHVSSAGAVSSSAALQSGSYHISAGLSDANGDTGTYDYWLTVNAVTLNQTAPFTNGGLVTPATALGFTSQLVVTPVLASPVTYSAASSTPPGVNISTTGAVSTTGHLSTGYYVVSGTTSDLLGDTGTYTYSLHVTPGLITQIAPTTGSVTTPNSAAFSVQLNVSGTFGTVSYCSGPNLSGLVMSSTGLITTSGTLPVNPSNVITCSVSDSYGDTGTYSYTLTVTAGTLVQTAPTSFVVNTQDSYYFFDYLNVSGSYGTLTFSPVTGPLNVNSSGVVYTNAPLAVGNYTVNGTVVDSNGDSGPYTYTLHVKTTLVQLAPVAGVATTTASTGFSAQLNVTNQVGPVTYISTGGSSSLAVSGTGLITVVGGPLAVGTYTKYVKFSDGTGAYGFGQFTLSVGSGTIVQTTPVSFTGDPITAQGLNVQLNTTGNNGAVTFTKTSSDPTLAVSPGGHVSVASSGLVPGVYTLSGTTSDPLGDTGTFSFTLTVNGSGGGILPGPVPTLPILVVTASSESVSAGAAVNETAAVTGLASGDTATAAGTVFTYVGTGGTVYGPSQVAPTDAGTYSVTPSGGTVTVTPAGHQANYSATRLYGNGVLTISGTAATSPPHITSTSGKVIHGKTTTLILHGSGFVTNGTVRFVKGGFNVQIHTLNISRVAVTVTASKTVKPGRYRLFFTNPDGGRATVVITVG
jgi:hypothetical protein